MHAIRWACLLSIEERERACPCLVGPGLARVVVSVDFPDNPTWHADCFDVLIFNPAASDCRHLYRKTQE